MVHEPEEKRNLCPLLYGRRKEMLAEERWNAILNILEKQKTVTVADLTEMLNTSESTIRRDLLQLGSMKKLVRVHGGATVTDMQYVPSDQSMTEKSVLMSREKKLIGEYAATLIKPGDFVYIDAGSTTQQLVNAITVKDAVYMTNSVSHARILLQKGMRVMVPGGQLKAATEAIVGTETVDAIRKLHFTIGFFGTNGVTDQTGFTTPEMSEAKVKETALLHSEHPYVLCDSTKFRRVSPVTFAEFEAAQILTDRISDKRYQKYKHITEVEQL